MENEIIRKSAALLASRLNTHIGKEGLAYTKMVLGMEIMIINVSKLIIIYLLAAVIGIVPQTVLLHGAYVVVKRYSFGLHALNSTVCTVVSCMLFVLVPWLTQMLGLGVGNAVVIPAFAAVVLCLYKYAPADTKARPLVGKKLRAGLRKRAVACGVILFVAALLVPNYEVKLLLTLGAVFQCVSILPITYKILKRSVRNYENYEPREQV